MKNIYCTLYTKELGRIELIYESLENFDINITVHRTDGPAEIYYYEDGSIEREYYYINDKLHRLDGPAFTGYNENGNIYAQVYYINNKCHKINGPAVNYYYSNGSLEYESYYINGKPYTKEDYYNLINEMKSLPESLRLAHEEHWVREL